MVCGSILVLIVTAVLLFNPFSLILFGVIIGGHEIKVTERKMQQSSVYEPAARTLAVYCQSDRKLFPEILSYAWLPQEVSQLGQPWCELGSNYAFVEMGGGFYHFGYRLTRDEVTSTRVTNVWDLSLARENSPDLHLMTLRLAATQQVTADDLEGLVGGTFDESIRQGHAGYQSKVILQLRFGHPAKAALTCEDWMKAKPESSVARLTYAHVRCRLGETDPAAAQFTDWVNAHKSFGNCILLAVFNFREGRTNQAVEAVRLARDQPLVDSPDVNYFYLGLNGAMIAYAGGDYDLCESLCNKLLADSNGEKWWRRSALRIKAAVAFMKGQESTALELTKQAENASDVGGFRFSQESQAKADERLLDSIQHKSTETVRDLSKWVDDTDKWYSPFETDESEFHGGLHVPTPYPRSWKTDNMNGVVDQ